MRRTSRGTRSSGSSTTRRRRPRAPCSRAGSRSTRSPSGSSAATASTSRPAASPTRTRIPGRASATCSTARSTSTPRGTPSSYGPGGAWFESGPDPVLAEASQHQPTAFVRVLILPAEWAGQAHDPLRRPRRRGSAEAPEADRLPRAPARSDVRTGGRLLVDQLVVHGVDVAFGVPGESYLAVLDALYDAPIRFVACRHEVGAANMADAYGKLTGRPGICMVTRGPGATHAAGGIHTAFQDSTPLILLIGQVGRDDDGPGGVPGDRLPPHVRADGEVGRADRRSRPDPRARLARLPRRHLRAARGPSCSRSRRTCSSRNPTSPTRSPARSSASIPIPRDVERARELLAGAERPLVVVGGAPWSVEAHDGSHRLVHRERAPGRLRLAPPGLRRQQLGRLRRPPRARRRPPARAARARRRRAARDRRPAERDHDGRLHAPRRAGSGPGAHPRHRRPRRARPGLHAGARRHGARPTRSPAPSRRCRRSSRARARRGRARGGRTISTTSAASRCPATSTWAR